MNIPGFLVANTLNTSVAQRLVRLLCPACKQEKAFHPSEYPRHFHSPASVRTHWVAGGCEQCHFTGYKGRMAVYEVIPIDRELAHEIKQGNLDVSGLLKERGIKTLADNAFDLFFNGQTSIDEVFPLLINY